jgi:hypothetical protein
MRKVQYRKYSKQKFIASVPLKSSAVFVNCFEVVVVKEREGRRFASCLLRWRGRAIGQQQINLHHRRKHPNHD